MLYVIALGMAATNGRPLRWVLVISWIALLDAILTACGPRPGDSVGAVSLEYVGVSGPSVLFDLKNGSAKKISFRGTYSMLKGADPWDSQIVCRTPNDTTGYEHPIALQSSIPANIVISPGDQMRLRIGNEIAAGDKGARCRLRLKLEDRTVLESTEFMP
jgi:hypothetical protein